MSELASFMSGAKATANGVTIRDGGLLGMITLRGDLSNAKLKAAVKKVCGQPVPAQRRIEMQGDKGVAWMSPDELLILVPYAEAGAAVAALSEALKGQHHLAVNVSDARGYMVLEGQGAPEVLAKCSPVDFPNFAAGDFRRTRIGQVAAAFWKDAGGAWHIVCFRSLGDYVFDLLRVSAAAGPVGAF